MANDERVPIWADGLARAGAAYIAPFGSALPVGADPGAPVVRYDPGEAAHRAGCACCARRGSLARAFAAIYVAMARRACPMSAGVVVVGAGPDLARAVAATHTGDVFVRARYRIIGRAHKIVSFED